MIYINISHKGIGVLAIAGALLIGGLGGSLIRTMAADAATTSTVTNSTTSTSTPPAQTDPSKGGHVGKNGVTEVLLTGTTAEKVKAAALAEVPGGTVLRVENDAEGATYEAHMTKADGTAITVFFDANFKVTSTEAGPGMPNHGQTTAN